MTDESRFITAEHAALVVRRLVPFAIGWLGTLAIWLLAFALEGTLRPSAVGIAALHLGILVVAGVLCLSRRYASWVLPVVVGACGLLGLASMGFIAAVGATGEILAFMLLTLYLAAALIFSWGWRAELVVVGMTLGPWALALDRFAFFVHPVELAAAITIGAMVSLAIAEGSARNLRAVALRRRWHEQATRELQASRDAYRDLAERAPEMIWTCDLEGRLTYVNEALERFVGLPAAAILGRSGADFWTSHPTNPDLPRLLATEPVPAASPIEIECLTPHGPRWVEVVMSIVADDHGAPVGFRGISRDVQERRDAETARRQAEADLRVSEERFRSAFDDAAIGMALTTTEGRTIRVNPALCAMLGYSEAEMLARTVEDVVHPDDRGPLEVDRTRLTDRAAQSYRAERRYLHKDGHLLWVHVTASIVRDATGTPLYYLGQIQDITERHLAEEALKGSLEDLRRSEEKLRLLARRQVAIREEERKRLGFDLHDDVCQELVGVGILVESLRRKLAPMAVEHSAEFERVVGYLNEVVEHLRLLARELRPFLLQDLGLDGSLRSLADGMSTPTLAIATDVPVPIPRLDEETEVTVYRIAQEALTNAVRHAGAHAIAVRLSVGGDGLELAVRDDGRGFDPKARPVLALGLASMEERALALGGRLAIRSAPNGGTTVTLTCPLEARSPGRFRELAAPSPRRSSSPLSAATTSRAAARDSPGRSRGG